MKEEITKIIETYKKRVDIINKNIEETAKIPRAEYHQFVIYRNFMKNAINVLNKMLERERGVFRIKVVCGNRTITTYDSNDIPKVGDVFTNNKTITGDLVKSEYVCDTIDQDGAGIICHCLLQRDNP